MNREDNRSRMPIVAQIVDELREQGLEPKVIWAKENGIEVGRRPDYEERERNGK